MSAWNEQKIALARKYWDEGLSGSEIARRIHITKNAVLGAAPRYGFPARVSPIRPRDPNKPQRKRAPAVTLSAISSFRASPSCETAWAEPAGDAQAVSSLVETSPTVAMPSAAFSGRWNNPNGERRAIPSLRPLVPTTPVRTCQYPGWGDGKPTHVYCGEPARIGSYCAAHFMVTHVVRARAGGDDPTAPQQEYARGA